MSIITELWIVFWTTWKPPSFLWGDGYDPWSQYATSTINFWTLHHHSGCISNGWRSGGGWHGRECLRILAWDKLWKEKSYRYSYLCYLVAVFLLDKIILFLGGVGNSSRGVGDGRVGVEQSSFLWGVVENIGKNISIFLSLFLLLHNFCCHLHNKGNCISVLESQTSMVIRFTRNI